MMSLPATKSMLGFSGWFSEKDKENY